MLWMSLLAFLLGFGLCAGRNLAFLGKADVLLPCPCLSSFPPRR